MIGNRQQRLFHQSCRPKRCRHKVTASMHSFALHGPLLAQSKAEQYTYELTYNTVAPRALVTMACNINKTLSLAIVFPNDTFRGQTALRIQIRKRTCLKACIRFERYGKCVLVTQGNIHMYLHDITIYIYIYMCIYTNIMSYHICV